MSDEYTERAHNSPQGSFNSLLLLTACVSLLALLVDYAVF